jgi:hypothetical protein
MTNQARPPMYGARTTVETTLGIYFSSFFVNPLLATNIFFLLFRLKHNKEIAPVNGRDRERGRGPMDNNAGLETQTCRV